MRPHFLMRCCANPSESLRRNFGGLGGRNHTLAGASSLEDQVDVCLLSGVSAAAARVPRARVVHVPAADLFFGEIMTAQATSVSQAAHRPGKIRALLAVGLVLGVGAAFTLAAWTDDEWVFGGAGPGDTPGTKTYAMQQNTVAPFADASWTDEPNANGGRLDFTIQATDLLPGDTVYAPFQLRAKAGSEALTVSLAEARQATVPAVGNANSTALYTAMRYQAWIGLDAADCSSAGDKTSGTVLVAADSGLDALGSAPFALPAGASGAPGAPVNLCFAMSLPAGTTDVTLQGKNVVPLWRFTSVTGQ